MTADIDNMYEKNSLSSLDGVESGGFGSNDNEGRLDVKVRLVCESLQMPRLWGFEINLLLRDWEGFLLRVASLLLSFGISGKIISFGCREAPLQSSSPSSDLEKNRKTFFSASAASWSETRCPNLLLRSVSDHTLGLK